MDHSEDVVECLKCLIDIVTGTTTTFKDENIENKNSKIAEKEENSNPLFQEHSLPLDMESDVEDDENSSSDTTCSSEAEDEAKICMKESKQEETHSISQVESIFKELLIQDTKNCIDQIYQLSSEKKLKPVGKISKIIENSLVIVAAYENVPALNLETLLFLQNRKVFGKILETFGPVILPHYVVTINPTEMSAELEQEVYFVPECDDVTSFILPSHLHSTKGSDASWLGDSEPPVDSLDYSDDEQERNAKRCKRKARPVHTKDFSAQLSSPRHPQQHSWHNVSTCFQRETNFNTQNFPTLPHPTANICPPPWFSNPPPAHYSNRPIFRPPFNPIFRNGNYGPFFDSN